MRLITYVLAISLLGVMALIGCNSAEKSKAKSIATASPGTTTPSDGARRVTVKELQDLLAKNEAVVIDVRNEAAYNSGHIHGSKLIPEADLPNHLNELPKDKLIVTYCS
ncbi:MAG TPA: rhodanese-like domain-containing protein [Pyrinomonadaceae bacterium]|nr:rhodanese-like domain-containing protein [Pyrinomonadaceae bacterium]